MSGSLGKRQISETITQWFHKRGDNNLSPAFCVAIVHYKFINFCKSKNLNIAVSEKQLKESISEATCVMYYGQLTNKDWKGPKRLFPRPKIWTVDYERFWNDHLEYYLFTNDFWTNFWQSIDVRIIEEDLPRWKESIQLVLPRYVLREIEILKTQGFIMEQKNVYVDEKTQEQVVQEDHDGDY